MKPLLTTITAYWGRPDALRTWLSAIRHSTLSSIKHLIYFVGSHPPEIPRPPNVEFIFSAEDLGLSIGYYHNAGATRSDSEWIMKLDIDTIPNTLFFERLLPVIQTAGEREWFNCGMLYLSRPFSQHFLCESRMPITPITFNMIMRNTRLYSASAYQKPAGTNFICRRNDYLDLGGCDARFRGYGWEDYQQIYMLESNQRQSDALPGSVFKNNVTQRCRDEISRQKAAELHSRDPHLCLLHRWHELAKKDKRQMELNRQVLWEHVQNLKAVCV